MFVQQHLIGHSPTACQTWQYHGSSLVPNFFYEIVIFHEYVVSQWHNKY